MNFAEDDFELIILLYLLIAAIAGMCHCGCLYHAGNRTWDFVTVIRVLYQLGHVSNLTFYFILMGGGLTQRVPVLQDQP